MKNINTMTICKNYSTCHQCRRDDGTWAMLVMAGPKDWWKEIRISHGICPDCFAAESTQIRLTPENRFVAPLPEPSEWDAPAGETLEAKCDRLERLFAQQRRALEELKCYVQAADEQINEALRTFK